MKVPLLDLRAQYEPLRREMLSVIEGVCDRQQFIMGPEVGVFEAEIAATLRVKHAIGVSSGTDALLMALMAIEVGPGDEIITSAFSFFATAGSVARLGATPVLVDINPVTYNLDPSAVQAAITPRTKAIMPVHLYGQSADMRPILECAGRAGIAVIEDAAQAVGAKYHDEFVAGFGLAGCISFFPTKNLGAFGDAGLVVTNDDVFAETARILRNHGAEQRYFHKIIGGNFRLDTLQAAVLSVKLPHMQGWTEARRGNAARYRQLFAARDLAESVVLPVEDAGNYHIYNQFVVRAHDRDGLRAHLQSAGVGTEIYYPVPFHLQECFRYLNYRRGQFPEAERAASSVLALPIFPELTEEQQGYVVDAIASYYGRRQSSWI